MTRNPIALLVISSFLLLAGGCQRGEPKDATPTMPERSSQTAVPGTPGSPVLAETFADIQVLRYAIPGFEALSVQQKTMLYYLYEAARAGRDIIFDQQYAKNLLVRRVLENIARTYKGDRNSPEFAAFMTYLKQVWFANGIHHHYSSKKHQPGFTAENFAAFVAASDATKMPAEAGPDVAATLTPILFDPKVDAIGVNRAEGVDLILDSANNFYDADVTQKEVEAFYAKKIDPKDARPISWGLNSKLVRKDGKLEERPWHVGGMYGAAIAEIVKWLEKAVAVAENEKQAAHLRKLIEYYRTGDLKLFDEYNILWVQDTDSRIDVVNGFIETYGDAMGYRATWESVVSIRDLERTKRIETIGAAAQWFEDNSPILPAHKKKEVVGISAKVITVVAEGGDAAPTTPVGINLPNAGWIRKEHGSKSVFLGNIVDAYQEVDKDSGVLEEFAENPEEVKRGEQFYPLGYALKVDMHEVIGHASGQPEPGVQGHAETLKAYASALEEARADLVALYYLPDPKLVSLGVVNSPEVAKAAYDGYIRSALLVQLARVELGEDIAQSHMRNRHMVAMWAYEHGKAQNVIERIDRGGNTYYTIRDYQKLRDLWAQLLREVQRIKSQGDYEAGKKLIETYGVKIDRAVHQNVLNRYAKLKAKPYSGFIQPELVPVMKDGAIVDVRVEYPTDFSDQMLRFSERYSFLPTIN